MKAVMKEVIVIKGAIMGGSYQKREETAALVAEEGFEPPTQGL